MARRGAFERRRRGRRGLVVEVERVRLLAGALVRHRRGILKRSRVVWETRPFRVAAAL